MINQYYLPLKIKRTEIFKPDWEIPTSTLTWNSAEYAKNILAEEFYIKLSTIVNISGAAIFNKVNHGIPKIAHVDIKEINGNFEYIPSALNIVFDTSTDIKGVMRWYSRKDTSKEPKVQFTHVGGNTPYLNFFVHELNLEEEFCIEDYATLVRTNVPHLVTGGNGRRTCVSIRYHNPYSWEEAVELFNQTFNC